MARSQAVVRGDGMQKIDGMGTDVLLVDFFDPTRSTTAEILRFSGFTVVETDDADIASECLVEQRFGLMLLDLDLPKWNGIELLQSPVLLPPVVILSALSIGPDECEGVCDKVLAYLQKPVEPRALIKLVRSVCSKGSSPHNLSIS